MQMLAVYPSGMSRFNVIVKELLSIVISPLIGVYGDPQPAALIVHTTVPQSDSSRKDEKISDIAISLVVGDVL